MIRTGRLEGKHAFITGAGSGIGAATARLFVAEGATVTGADREYGAMPVAQHSAITAVRLDVRDEGAVRAALHAAEERAPIDILVNVAGIGSTTTAPDTPPEAWRDVIDVNLTGTFHTCKHVIPRMAERGAGAIVNIASIAGLVGLRSRAAYCASKGGVIALTRAMALDHVAEGLRINCLCPGTVDSPWVRRLVEDAGESLDDLRARQPMGRLGTPEEIASAVLFLAADSGSFATGTALVLDGGLTAA